MVTTENEIWISARRIFLLYGFHGTTIQRIAADAKVSNASIHYYFRSKEKLYQLIINEVVEIILSNSILKLKHYDIIWFVINEMRNNKILFIYSLNHSVEKDWKTNINKLITIALAKKSPEEIISLMKH